MDLAKDNIFKLLLKFSIPAITGMLVNALYNMVDRIFVNYGVGPDAFSALTVSGPASLILLAFNMLVGIGAASCISLKMGEGNKEDAEKVLGNAFVCLLFTSFILMVLGLKFLDPILYFFGASDVTIDYSREYMQIIIGGFPFMTLGFGMYHMTRASGNPTRAMFSMILGAVLNIVLDAIFIFVFKWGIKGAAIATIISQAVSMFFVLSFFLRHDSYLRLKIKNFKLEPHIVNRIYAIGISAFCTQIAASGIGALINRVTYQYGGDDAIGAYGAIYMVVMLFAMPVFGLNQGAQPVLGYNYGAKQFKRTRQAIYYTMITAFGIGLIATIFVLIFAPVVINFFTNGYEGINRYAIPGIKRMFILFPLGMVQIVGSVFFQAIGKAKITLFLSLLRQVIMLIPLVIIMPMFLGIDGVWYSFPVADGISFAITIFVLRHGLLKMKETEQSSKLAEEVAVE